MVGRSATSICSLAPPNRPPSSPQNIFETILKELHLACRIGGGSSDTVRRGPGPLAETSRGWG